MRDYIKMTMAKISEGYVPGGYRKLKEKHPKVIEEMERDLENNFTKDGLKIYANGLIKGLKAAGAYND